MTSVQASFRYPRESRITFSVGYCACINWMKWKLSPEGGKQVSATLAVAADGMTLGKQIEMDETLATKLDTEERLREAAKATSH